MRICLVFYDMQDFGGLEEYAVSLAVSLKQSGHQVSVLSTAWITPDNQYFRILKKNDVDVVQLPKWLSLCISNWHTKEKILALLMRIALPFVYFLAGILFIRRRNSWAQSLTSARGWLHGRLQNQVVGPDRRKPFTRLLLNWWKFYWRPDLLHLQGYTTNLLFVIDWAYKKNVPVVYEEHQTPDPQFTWWKDFQETINKSSIVVAVSEKSAEGLRSVCGVTQPIVVRAPLLADPFASGWSKTAMSQKSDGEVNITTVARLYVTKGLTYLLEAIAQIKKTHPSAHFKIFGDGILRQDLLAYAEQLELDGDQIFAGIFNHKDLGQIMANTDIFAMSSILEGQPLAVVEAMSYGCPIVTTDVGGIPELIKDGINGLLCKPRDSAGLARNISCLIDHPELRERLGQAARKSYEQGPYQPASVSGYFVTIYEKVLLEKNRLKRS
jgi:glycosyltransferase involved in cell wall biosynthesis